MASEPRVWKRKLEPGSGSGGSGPFSAEAEARKFNRFRFHIGMEGRIGMEEEWREKRNGFCYLSDKSK